MESTMTAQELYTIHEMDLIYRNPVKMAARPLMKCSEDIHTLMMQSWDLNKIELYEEFKVIYLNHGARVLGIATLSSGGMTQCVVDVRLLFSTALVCGATHIIMVHNHPSGILKPSEPDKTMTRKVKEAGALLDIKLLDHLIVTEFSYCSMLEEGFL